MFDTIETKFLELFVRLQNLRSDERGQTSAEYVAVTAVAVAIALGVIYVTLSGALSTAVGDIGDKVKNFVSSPPSTT